MREDFLHYLWRLQRFDHQNLQTTTGARIELLEPGTYNRDAGPDFLNARIRIDGTLWAGNVEMHLRSSEWLAHQHQHDPAYRNVILHVVLEEDVIIRHLEGERIPCLNLRKHLPIGLSKQYLRLLHSEYWIPCEKQFYQAPEVTRSLFLDRLLVERLEDRTTTMRERLNQNQQDWEETFYQLLTRGFGLHVNADPFLMLAESLPLRILLRHKHSLLQLEALLFGQAGFLDGEYADAYPERLLKEYRFLRHKYQLTPIPNTLWKFMRMRPANFPTVRLAQLATLISRSGQLFSKMMVAQNVREIKNALVVELSNYWQTHYRFNKESKKSNKSLGQGTIHLLIINVIAPFLFLYGQMRGDDRFKDRALQLLEELPAEKNRLISGWQKLGMEPANAFTTQALLELKNNYCDKRRCLECAIGCAILKRKPMAEEDGILYLPTWSLVPAAESRSKGA